MDKFDVGSFLGDFRDQMLGLATVLNAAVLGFLAKLIWPDLPAYGWVLVVLIAVVLAAAELHALGRAIGRDLFTLDFKQRAARMAAVGLGLGLILAITLLVIENRDRSTADDSRREAELVREQQRAATQNPDVQRGAEYMRKMRERQERAATRNGG